MSSIKTLGDLLETMLRDFKDKIYKSAPFDKTFKGRILEMKNPRKYVVEINGQSITATAHETYNVGDSVWLTYPRNNQMNAFISCKTQ